MNTMWQLRPAGRDDLPAIVEIIRAEDLLHRGHSDIDLEVSRERIAADPGFDAERDQIVAEVEGQLIAAVILNPRAANIAVCPDRDLPGLREDLLAWTQDRQRELGRECVVAVPAANTRAVKTYLAAGYRLERFYAEMVRDFADTAAPEDITVPDGYRLRAIRPEKDVEALHRLDDRAFRDQPDYAPESLEEYDRRHVSFSQFASPWSFVLESDSGELGGSLIGSRRPGRPGGYIAVLAVDPDHRRRGLARTLLLSAFRAISAAGLATAELHVASDNPRALDLYTGVGMTQGERFDHYIRAPG
jgi:ribosomal protein S18 acetylase RimI-like enzyme